MPFYKYFRICTNRQCQVFVNNIKYTVRDKSVCAWTLEDTVKQLMEMMKEIKSEMKVNHESQNRMFEKLKATQISRDQFEEMQANQDSKLKEIKVNQDISKFDARKVQLRNHEQKLYCVIGGKVTNIIQEVTGRIGGVQETVQNLRK